LSAGIVAVGGIGVLAAGALARWVPRYSPFATRAMVRERRERVAAPPSPSAQDRMRIWNG
jgi:hypothetical protein